MRTKSRPITGPFATQRQKTGTRATLPTTCITSPFAPQKQKTGTCATLLPTCITSHRSRPACAQNTPHNRPVRPPKAKDRNLCYPTNHMHNQPYMEPTRHASKNTPLNQPTEPTRHAPN